MTIIVAPFIDFHRDLIPLNMRRYGTKWAHMSSNESEEELVEFAVSIGMRKEWIQVGGMSIIHFDITPARRLKAIRDGAVQVSHREFSKQAIRRRDDA